MDVSPRLYQELATRHLHPTSGDTMQALTLIRMTKDEKVLAFFKGLLL
jgi:hypothetical protein